MAAELFFTFAFIGAFSFGGGYGMLPLIQEEVVYNHHWLTNQQFADILAVAEMTPGPIAINTATFVGYKTAGFWGSLLATVGVVLPSFLLIAALTGIVLKNKNNPLFQGAFHGLRPVVVALVVGAALLLGQETITGPGPLGLSLAALALMKFTNIHPIAIILGFGALGMTVF